MHILGVSSLAAAHLTLVPELKAELDKQGRGDIMIVVGGVVPPQDYDALKAAGAEAIFPPGTVIAEAAEACSTRSTAGSAMPRRRRNKRFKELLRQRLLRRRERSRIRAPARARNGRALAPPSLNSGTS